MENGHPREGQKVALLCITKINGISQKYAAELDGNRWQNAAPSNSS